MAVRRRALHPALSPAQARLTVSLHQGQQRAQDSTKKVVLVIAGTGGGKTAYAPLWALTERARIASSLKITTSSGIVVAPYKILRRTTMPAFLRLFQHKLRLGEWESRADGIWRFYDGGYVYFCSADTPESIEGAHVHWAVLDEMGQRQFPEESFRAAERRVRFFQGRILGVTTPYVLGWLKELADASSRPPSDPTARPDVEVITFPSISNPKFPQVEFDRARATLPPWMFRMFYQGEWDRPSGLVYGTTLDDRHWIPITALPDQWPHWPVYAGVDFGYNAPHAMVYATRDPATDVLYVFDEYYQTERTNAQHARLAPHREHVRMAYGDPAAPEAIAEFVNEHWRMTAAPSHHVVDGLKEVFERLATDRLFFVRGQVPELAKELDSYVWDADRADGVIKVHDHGPDALRYLCWGLRSAGKPLPDQPHAPGRFGRPFLSPEVERGSLEEGIALGSGSSGLHLGTRALTGSRLSGLPRRVTSRREG